MFTHLHGHSHYSLLEAIGKPKDIVATAKEMWMEAIALTDYSWMYGAIEFYQACMKAEIKPILWVEFGFTMDLSSKQSHGTITLLIPTTIEYHNMLKLTSHANMEGYTSMATIDLVLLKQYGEWLICIIWWEASYLATQILQQEEQSKILEQLKLIQSWLWETWTLVLELVGRDHEGSKKLAAVNNEIIELSQKLGVDYIVSWNYHYVSDDQSKAFETALSIKDGKRIYDEDRRLLNGKRHIKTEDEIMKVMKKNWFSQEVVELWMENTQKICDMTDLKIELNQLLFPNYKSPDEIKELYEEHKNDMVVSG